MIADHGRAEARRAVELLGVVRLDERVEPEPLGVGHQRRGRRVVEVAEDEERGVGAGFAHLAQMLGRREEALREERDVGHGPGGAEVVERAGEALVDEHRDRARAGARVRRDDVLDARVRTDVAHRRRAPLELGDRAEPGLRERVR